MPIELTLLALSAVLCVLMGMLLALGLAVRFGVAAAAGNREALPPLTGWIGRAKRAHANMVENLVPFAAVVLAAQAAGKLGAATALGAQLFFWCRVGYAIVYTGGIPYLRSVLWAGSVVGMVMIVVALFR